jgi:hypothetical protein
MERVYPLEENLGRDCKFWRTDTPGIKGCNFPKLEMRGRLSCEGIVDKVCIFLRVGKQLEGLDEDSLQNLKFHPPKFGQKHHLPGGDNKDNR